MNEMNGGGFLEFDHSTTLRQDGTQRGSSSCRKAERNKVV